MTVNQICIFEDSIVNDLNPITANKPVYSLLVGIDRLFDKTYRYFGHINISLHCRDYIKSQVKSEYSNFSVNSINTGSGCLFINGRVMMTDELAHHLNNINDDENVLFTFQGHVVATYLQGELLDFMRITLGDVPTSKQLIDHLRTRTVIKELPHVHILSNVWDPVYLNNQAIVMDFKYKNNLGIIKGHLNPFVSVYEENNVFVDHSTVIEDFVVLNAKEGPIYIEDNVYIEANTRLEGPLYIGSHAQILGGKIKGASIGAHCKVSGEVSMSVFQPYSNKAHSGFVGHSYIGSWVNLGASTTTSNLKNNYNTIQVQLNQQTVQSDCQFLGSIIGDYSKTGIGTLLNAGTVIGMGSVLSNHLGTYPKFIPPFSWSTSGKMDTHDLGKFLESADKMMERRDQQLGPVQKELYSYLHKQSL